MPIKPSRLLAIRSSSLSSSKPLKPTFITLRPFSSSSASSSAPVPTTLPPDPSNPWTYPSAIVRPPTSWRQDPSRTYPDRKAYQYAYYSHLCNTSPLVLLFEYNYCNTALLEKIRMGIARIPQAFPPTVPLPGKIQKPTNGDESESSSPSPRKGKKKSTIESESVDPTVDSSSTNVPTADLRAKLMIVRSGVLGAVHRARPRESSLAPWCEGQRAFIVCPIISGAYIGKVLKVVKQAVKEAQKPNKSPLGQPALNLLVGLLEGNRVVPASEIEALTKMSELDTLRAQVVGMLEGQGRSLVGLLGQAGGGALVRTLQGLEEGMKGPEAKA